MKNEILNHPQFTVCLNQQEELSPMKPSVASPLPSGGALA